MSSNGTVLFVDDEQHILSSLRRNLLREPYRCLFAASGAAGLALLEKESVQVVVSDMRMPEMDGLTFLNEVRARYPDVIRMVLSGTADMSHVLHAVNSGEVYRFLTKPLDEIEGFRQTLRQALEFHALRTREKELLQELAERNHELSQRQERMDYELHLAGQIQRRVLNTKSIITPDYEIRFAYRPSFSIGGDFFDAVALSEGRFCVYLGDVSGHGVAAALIATFMRITASDMVLSHIEEGPAAVCRALNRFMIEQHLGDDIFATFFIAVYDPSSRHWQACNCGHPMPVMLSADGSRLSSADQDAGDVPLGIMDRPGQYGPDVEASWDAGPGDILLLFTDGLYESRHRETQALCGLEVLTEGAAVMLQRAPEDPAPERILAWLEEQGYQIDGDDCCAITVRHASDRNPLWRKSVDASLSGVDSAACELENALLAEGWDVVAAGSVRLLFMEYGVNVVRHGGVPAGSVLHCCLQRCKDGCLLLFRDSGVAWDYSATTVRAGCAAPDAENGRGLAIIASIADHVNFFRWGQQNHASFVVMQQHEERKVADE